MRLSRVFDSCQSQGRAAAVAFTVAGYPTQDATIEVLLTMQRGGIDIVELGVPSSDAIGDGPIIQDAHAVAVQLGCDFQKVLDLVQRARGRGLVIPVVIMGYCNPVLQYGVERAIEHASRVEVDGFLLADLPVIESVRFRRLCKEVGLSYIPVISPNMKDEPESISPEEISLHVPPVGPDEDMVCLARGTALPSYFGPYGGQFVPELLLDSLQDLEKCFIHAKDDPEFWRQYESHLTAMTDRREESFQIDDEYGLSGLGATVWQLQNTAPTSHSPARYRLYSTLGQILLACRLGKKRILAETTCEADAVATATLCARLGVHCILFIGARDLGRCPELSAQIDQIGGTIITASCGGQVVRDAINAALQHWIADLDESHYVPSFAIGPHPYPTIVRSFQTRFGTEMWELALSLIGKSPDVVVMNATAGHATMALVSGLMDTESIDLVLIDSRERKLEASPGVFHGSWTEVQQDKAGQVPGPSDPRSHGYCTYPALEPEVNHWISTGKARLVACGGKLNPKLHDHNPAGGWIIHVAKGLANQHQKGHNILAIVS